MSAVVAHMTLALHNKRAAPHHAFRQAKREIPRENVRAQLSCCQDDVPCTTKLNVCYSFAILTLELKAHLQHTHTRQG